MDLHDDFLALFFRSSLKRLVGIDLCTFHICGAVMPLLLLVHEGQAGMKGYFVFLLNSSYLFFSSFIS